MPLEQQALTPPADLAKPAIMDQRAKYQGFVDRITTQVISAMPLTVPDADLKRSRARFRVAFSADAQGALMECTPDSVARAIVLSAMSGLYPGGPRPDVWLIPRRNKHKNNLLEAQWQMSFRGYIRLARRAGWELEPVLVFEGEKFEIREGDKPSIEHVRNLDVEASWNTLRYGYIRAYPTGRREAARYAYLTKAEIQKRRNKAQDQNIWNEWPLEMAYKTLCQYAGAREIFPTDDPARYAMEASDQAEIGGGSPVAESLPSGSKTEGVVARLAARPAAGGVIDLAQAEERPIDLTSVTPTAGEEAPGVVTITMTSDQVGDCIALADRSKVALDDLEGYLGSRLQDLEGETTQAVESRVVAAINHLKKSNKG